MAGRPVNEAQREKRRQEVDAAIVVIRRRKQPVTKKAIADEMGLSIQSFYAAGFLRQYAAELENSGVIIKERGRPLCFKGFRLLLRVWNLSVQNITMS